MFIVICVIVVVLVVDKSIVPAAVYTGGIKSSILDITTFILLALAYGIGQWIVLQFVDTKFQTTTPSIKALHTVVLLAQYILISIIGLIVVQMIFTSSYSALLMKICIWLNYVLMIAILGILSHRFYVWQRTQRNATVLLYCVTMALLSFSGIVTIVYMQQQFSGQQRGIESVKPQYNIFSTVVVIDKTIPSLYGWMSILSFVSFWVSTVVLLNNYSKKIGSIKYWVLVSFPLLYFLSQYQSLVIELFYPLRIGNPALFGILFVFLFAGAKPLGGLLFGFAFWSISRNVNVPAIKVYTMTAAFGTMLLFTSNQPTGLAILPYPPFGIPTICFLGLSSYLLFLGIYTSAVSVSNDSRIRSEIMRSVAKESSGMLKDIGTAQMQNQLEKRVLELTKRFANNIENQTGVESSLREEEIKDYVNQVIREVHPEEGK